ncbi:TPA: hypothetical protein ACH3X1_001859 [Trebouxia sp. C0004]
MDAILKLDNSPNEGDLLSRLKGSTHLVEVLCDVAGGIANAANRDIAHRDITPNNFGQLEGRGYLFNFSAAKVNSSVLEGLFISALSISCNGKASLAAEVAQRT